VPGAFGLAPHSVPRRRLAARVRRFRGRLVVAVDDVAHELAESAELIFTSIDGAATIDEIAVRLARCYGIDDDVARADTAEFVAWLVDHHLIDIDLPETASVDGA
jgi:Coenzyme PQQ synthesis protein D (PqqD)